MTTVLCRTLSVICDLPSWYLPFAPFRGNNYLRCHFLAEDRSDRPSLCLCWRVRSITPFLHITDRRPFAFQHFPRCFWCYVSGRLLALAEGGMPYALRVMCDGVIETIGRVSYGGEMKTAFTAHPKRDPATGKLYGFGYQARISQSAL